MFGKKFSIKIKSVITLVTISVICLQLLTGNQSAKMVTVGTVTGNVIAFEETHYPMTSINASNDCFMAPGAYDSFVEQLENNSFVVETIDEGETLNQLTLQNYDILVILASQTVYTAEEITEIDTWVKNGGKILLIIDWLGFGEPMRGIVNNFGFDYPASDGIHDSDDIIGANTLQFYLDTNNMADHPITENVDRIELYAATGITSSPRRTTDLIYTDNDGTATWETGGAAKNIPVLSCLAGRSLDNGKLVLITEANLWSDSQDTDLDGDLDFFDSDNAQLALNVINWLADPTMPVSIDFFSIITLITLASIVIIKRKRK